MPSASCCSTARSSKAHAAPLWVTASAAAASPASSANATVVQAIAAERALLAASSDVVSNSQIVEAVQLLGVSAEVKSHLAKSLSLSSRQLDRRPAAPTGDVTGPPPAEHTSDLESDTLQDLLDLEELGYGVAWPCGLDSRIAKLILKQRNV